MGTVVGLVIGAASVWATVRVGSLRRRLYYGMRAAAPLLTAPHGMRNKLELRYDGTALTDPRVITVELSSRSRKDIANDAYNGGQPLLVDVGAPIMEVLQITSVPKTYPQPSVVAHETALAIGPSLIGRRHDITITVLTDGGTPSLSCRSPLIDVRIDPRLVERAAADRRQLMALGAIAVVAAGAIGGILGKTVFAGPSGPAHEIIARATVDGYTRSTNLEKQLQVSSEAAQVTSNSGGQAHQVVAAVYQQMKIAPGTTGQIFMFVGGKLADGDPSASIASFEQAYPGTTVVSAGTLGGQAACTETHLKGESESMCVWFDNDTFGTVVSPTMTTTKLAATMIAVRPSLELHAK